MISPVAVEEIRRLLATGAQSLRKIARRTGVSRGTVAAIAHGKRPDRPPHDGGSEDLGEEPPGPVERCPQCGALAQSPCRACRVRSWLHNTRRKEPRLPPEEPLEMELVGECRQRYEEVRARRIREGWE
jgi:hypothetical protein